MFSNWKIKLNTVILACILWLFVVHNQHYETYLDIPLVPTHLRQNKIIVSDIPKTVPVRFAGSGKDLQILKFLATPYIDLDLHTINYFYDYPIRLEFVVMPSGSRATPIAIGEPDTVKILLEDLEEKYLPVKPAITFNTEPGYTQVGGIRVSPESVLVRGPRKQVRSLSFVETETRKFPDLAKSIRSYLQVEKPESTLLTLDPSEVSIRIEVDKIAERTFKHIPVLPDKKMQGRRMIVEPSRVEVTLRGSAKVLTALTSDSIHAYVPSPSGLPQDRIIALS